jgi:hypothetical protein
MGPIGSKILLYAIIAAVVFFTFLGVKRVFTVFFVGGSCCSNGKGLAKKGGRCCCSKEEDRAD